MKKIIKLLCFPLLAISSFQLSSCNLHAHNFEYKYDENSHWQECSICKKKIGVSEHSMDALTDKCFVCNYHDPVVKTNGSATAVGLTNYGKTKQTIHLSDSILSVGARAFAKSECTKLYIPENLIGMEDGALEDSKIDPKTGIVDPDEGLVEWKKYGGYYLRKNKIQSNEALVKDGANTKYYKTLKEAIEADGGDDVTITLLHQQITLNADIDVKKTITLEPLFIPDTGKFEILDNGHRVFIHPSGSLTVPKTISYNAPTDLIRTITVERRGDTQDNNVWVFGSLVLSGTNEIPQTINVNYVSDDKVTQLGKAVGNVQVTGSGLSETTNVAYGVFKMREVNGQYQIKGLSKFGETVTKLKITNPIEGKEFIIDDQAFVIKGKIQVPLPLIKDPTIWLMKQKGCYTSLDIGEGITAINTDAFSTAVDGHITREILIQLAGLLCPLTTLKISNGVKYVGLRAFYQCMSLSTVEFNEIVTENRPDTTVNNDSFAHCYNLKRVDFKNCPNLKMIMHDAFNSCDSLYNVDLPSQYWMICTGTLEKYEKKYEYLPEDLTPENVAAIIKTTYCKLNWIRRNDPVNECKFAYCYNRDANGKFNTVEYFSDFNAAFKKYKDTKNNEGCTIRILKNAGTDVTLNLNDSVFTKDLHIIADDDIKVKITSDKQYLVVNEDKWLIVSKNIEFGPQINLRCKVKEESGSYTYTNVAGFAKVSGGEYQSVGYSVNGTEFVQAQPTNAVIDGAKHSSYGLFNFNVKRIGDNRYQKLLSLTSLGSWATEISARCPELGKAEYINDCIIAANAFNGKEKINKIELHDEVKEIETSAFANCQFLTEVSISTGLKTIGENAFFNCQRLKKVVIEKQNTVLNKICKGGFNNCTSLTYFDFGSISSGWKAGGVPITEDLSTPSIAAKTIIGEHSNVDWTRE